ncbi:MAG: serine/threonine protein kinase, bacterial [Mycobacterium sp.]|jgi:serine/threonine-protein kinase|nr:serine/threonine protein kinase, bacterial [Mycobacterium sp.]
MALARGATFAFYTVVRMLSSSATGEVYLAERSGLPGWQALKVLPMAPWADGDFRERFHRETQIAAGLYHPNVLEVQDRGEFEGQLWIAMDYVDGDDAAKLMANRFPAVLPVGEALAMVAAAAAGLDFAHERGMLHRDVRPANILMTTPGAGEPRILLTDFGLARPAGESAYAAPEESNGTRVDGRADQYALAATALHLLTGSPPASPGPSELRGLRPDLARLDDVLAKALAADPSDRFGSCRDFAAALAEHAGIADRRSEPLAVTEPPVVTPEPAYVVDYPAYGWPDASDAAAKPITATGTKKPTNKPAYKPGRHRPRRILIGAAAVLVMVGLLAVGIMIGRQTNRSTTQAGSPATSTMAAFSAAPSIAPRGAVPLPLEGTFLIEVQRSQQTFDNTPNPQPPDVSTYWAIRSSCTPIKCLAAATLLNGNDHTQPKSPDVHPLILEFDDGQWRSRPETTKFPCIDPNGVTSAQTTVQVVSLRPQPQGNLVGEMVVTVKSNECHQQGGVIRIPTEASRSGDTPPGVNVPDPVRISPTTSEPPTVTPTGPPTTPSKPR